MLTFLSSLRNSCSGRLSTSTDGTQAASSGPAHVELHILTECTVTAYSWSARGYCQRHWRGAKQGSDLGGCQAGRLASLHRLSACSVSSGVTEAAVPANRTPARVMQGISNRSRPSSHAVSIPTTGFTFTLGAKRVKNADRGTTAQESLSAVVGDTRSTMSHKATSQTPGSLQATPPSCSAWQDVTTSGCPSMEKRTSSREMSFIPGLGVRKGTGGFRMGACSRPMDMMKSRAFSAAACSAPFFERAKAVKCISEKPPWGVCTAGMIRLQVNLV